MSSEKLIHLSESPSIGGLNPPATIAKTAAVQVEKVDDGRAAGPICVVDDDEWVTDSIATLLETYGFSVRSYNSAAQYLADRRRNETQCLIIDQHMPGVEGLDAVATLHREAFCPPTVLITGRLDAAISRRADQLGVQAILEKPFAAARLVTLIRSLLDRRD